MSEPQNPFPTLPTDVFTVRDALKGTPAWPAFLRVEEALWSYVRLAGKLQIAMGKKDEAPSPPVDTHKNAGAR